MQKKLPNSLLALAKACEKPLYIVGGFVRDHLAHMQSINSDLDICSPLSAQRFAEIAAENGFSVQAVYRNTGTVKLSDCNGSDYEFSCFRHDKYVRGQHTPTEIFFTEDILLDARRRDFTCNAVYYDIVADKLIDPLQRGVDDIAAKRLHTVTDAKKVFGEDGLRLMRLARQAAQLGFTPTEECLQGAKENAALIADISPERIYAELTAILHAEEKYGVQHGAYHGLKLLEESGVLAHILPELWIGKGMTQRADFHKYDVLEHSLKAVYYAQPSIRLAALLHDVAKPYCKNRDGNFYQHADEGERMTTNILSRLRAPKKVIEETAQLVKWHMYDLNGQVRENKLRRFLVQHNSLLPKLLALKQADFSACTDDTSIAPTCLRWNGLLKKMQKEKVPFSLRELCVNGKEIETLGIAKSHIAKVLHALLMHVAIFPKENQKQRLLGLAQSIYPTLLS